MSFRSDSGHARNWSIWLAKNRSELVESGVQDFIYSDEARWSHFIGHGYGHETGWIPEMLPAAKLLRLKAFMTREYPGVSLPAELRLPADNGN